MEGLIEVQQKPEITLDTLFSLDIRFCKIESVEDIFKNPKKPFDLVDNPVKGYKLTVNTGFDVRTIVTNIVHIPKDLLTGAITPFILNLPEATIRGVNSKGMIFMTDHFSIVTGNTVGKVVI